ncbi:MAG: hypothetical protein RLZZ450_4562 [Pseudomonadota bacterium]|jgi:hypothetical protein
MGGPSFLRSPALGRASTARAVARRLFPIALCATLLVACAEGGLSDDEVNAAQDDAKGDDGDDEGTTASKDGGVRKDAGPSKDAGRASDGGRSGAASTDAGKTTTSTSSRDGGGSTLPTIKCPSNLVCTSDISIILGALDPNVKADTLVCAQSGLLPMPVSCKSDDECKSARLTSGKCTGSYCIQACVK